jgi:hypothetical protein
MTYIGLEHSDYMVYVDESGDHSLTSERKRGPSIKWEKTSAKFSWKI